MSSKKETILKKQCSLKTNNLRWFEINFMYDAIITIIQRYDLRPLLSVEFMIFEYKIRINSFLYVS